MNTNEMTAVQKAEDKEKKRLTHKKQSRKASEARNREKEDELQKLIDEIRTIVDYDAKMVLQHVFGNDVNIHIHRVKVDDERTRILLQHEFTTGSVLDQNDRVVRQQIDTWINTFGIHVIMDSTTSEIHSVIRASPHSPCPEAGIGEHDIEELHSVMNSIIMHSGATGSPAQYHAVRTMPPEGTARKQWQIKNEVWGEKDPKFIKVTGSMQGIGMAGKMKPGIISEPYSLSDRVTSGPKAVKAQEMFTELHVPQILNRRVGKLSQHALDEAQMLAYTHNLPSFNFIPYGAEVPNERAFPAIWIVSNCFSNVLHLDEKDKTKSTYVAWWQAHFDAAKAEWTIADRPQDKGKVQRGAFLLASLGVAIDLETLCGAGFVEAIFTAKRHWHVTTSSFQVKGYTRHGLGIAITSRQVNNTLLAQKAMEGDGEGVRSFTDTLEDWTSKFPGRTSTTTRPRAIRTPSLASQSSSSSQPRTSSQPTLPPIIQLSKDPERSKRRYQPPGSDTKAGRKLAVKKELEGILASLKNVQSNQKDVDALLSGGKAVWKRVRDKMDQKHKGDQGDWEEDMLNPPKIQPNKPKVPTASQSTPPSKLPASNAQVPQVAQIRQTDKDIAVAVQTAAQSTLTTPSVLPTSSAQAARIAQAHEDATMDVEMDISTDVAADIRGDFDTEESEEDSDEDSDESSEWDSDKTMEFKGWRTR
ncbi:hypothetical protein BS47DRAFT_1362061 [Hydnum rufescens UP504]|uniref:Tet-like 2OG-Fe(II) oxygenase domain-containing protein n=1 Tax=Hydnum rufescens UP504 TaxID=1448309 RepID=A0A9P6AXT3_9AGAM|nr:hypothetical protein BS47DRAFT_1362061 [Hydnum rufescens UP504]